MAIAATSATTPAERLHEASERLYTELRFKYGNGFAADQRVIRAIAEYARACRDHAPEEDLRRASEHLYTALRFRLGANFGADQRIIRALAEYMDACRAEAH